MCSVGQNSDNMPKVSVVMPVYNAETFLEDSINSILNQTLTDLELICVDDGSIDNSLNILNTFKEKDSRVKVFGLKHEGGGNARNYGLEKVTGKYLYLMDADDIINLNAFEDFYEICEKNNLDFVIFKAMNYGVEKDHYFETDYQNMKTISNRVQNNVFNYEDLGDLLFDLNVSPWCKFYNHEFIKKTGARFREHSKFHDNQFFWDIIFKAKRILFIDEFYYTRKRYDESLTSSGNKNHIQIIGVVNDIIKLFIKNKQLERYKRLLYNHKIIWITDRYNQVGEEVKTPFLKEMKKDYESLKNTDFPDNLDSIQKFIYNSARISKNPKDFDELIKIYSITTENNTFDEKVYKIEEWFNSLNPQYHPFALNTIKTYFKDNNKNKINSKNLIFYKKVMNSMAIEETQLSEKILQLQSKLDDASNDEISKELTAILNDYKNNLITIQKQNDEIEILKKEIETDKSIIENNTATINHLNSKIEFLSKKNNNPNYKRKTKNKIKKLLIKR